MARHHPPFPLFPAHRCETAALALAALIGALALGLSLLHGPGGQAAAPQWDSLIFQQYARAMAEGHPYRFNPGDPPSTGSTSHLWPLVLAGCHRLGLRGDALTTANLALNLIFYLISMALLLVIARRLDRRAAPLALLLCVLSGQSFLAFFLLTDMGLFTILALGALTAALFNRRHWLALSLVLAAWCRPEGLVLSVLLLAIAFLPASLPLSSGSPSARRGWLLAGLAGAAAFGGALLLNRVLTGSFQFQSVQGKGAIPQYGLAGGLFQTSAKLAEDLGGGLFNLAHPNRSFYGVPLLSGVLGLLGLLSRRWRTSVTARVELWWALAALAAAALVASSGWDGMQYDKYWAWFLPVWTIYVAIGVRQVARRLPWRGAGVALATLLIVWQAVGLVHFGAVYSQATASMPPVTQFLGRVDATLPAGARLGCFGKSGMAYFLPRHPVYNIFGIGAPSYRPPEDPLQVFDILRHRPELRFESWLLGGADSESWIKPLVGPQLFSSPPVFGGNLACAVHKATWDALAGTTAPLAAALPPGARLADAMDVGYPADEARCAYDLFTRLSGARLAPLVVTGKLAGRTLAETGRVVIGAESFRLSLTPGRAVRLVLRGALKGDAEVLTAELAARSQSFEFSAPLKLNVLVDDRSVGQWVLTPPAGADLFEAVYDLPAAAITSDHPVITIGGDHISLGYWAYQ